jgi:hypothetical protein
MRRLYSTPTILLFAILVFFSCKKTEPTTEPAEAHIAKKVPKKAIEHQRPKAIGFHLENSKQWLTTNKDDLAKLNLAYAINRTDKQNFTKIDSVLIPDDFSGDIVYYFPFPLHISALEAISKIIIFSYPTQTFAAYEEGELVQTGPTNMGRKKDPTPIGLFYTNWKAEKTTSTFNDEWELKWNFNIENKLGVGFHQYTLPGYPASHSCLRLEESDAKFLYKWADEWILKDRENIKVKGTPVLVFGSYDFDAPKPWLQLIKDPKALDISEAEIVSQLKPFIQQIIENQKRREEEKELQTQTP